MEYRTWPALDARVSLLGFGCMRFPTDDAGCVQEDAAAAMLRRALEAGVNYIDTAYFYHEEQSERVLGRVLADVPRERYYLATKLPTWKVESLEDAQRFFTTQLERLNTDHFDFYLLHTLNRDRWRAMVELGVVDWCVQKQREGAICRFGFSFHDGYDVFEEILSFRKWDFCQIQFNYLDTDIQAGERGYALAEQLGVPLVIMEPVKGGALADLPEDLAARTRQCAHRSQRDEHPGTGGGQCGHLYPVPAPDAGGTGLGGGDGRGPARAGEKRLHRLPLLHALPCRSEYPGKFPTVESDGQDPKRRLRLAALACEFRGGGQGKKLRALRQVRSALPPGHPHPGRSGPRPGGAGRHPQTVEALGTALTPCRGRNA